MLSPIFRDRLLAVLYGEATRKVLRRNEIKKGGNFPSKPVSTETGFEVISQRIFNFFKE